MDETGNGSIDLGGGATPFTLSATGTPAWVNNGSINLGNANAGGVGTPHTLSGAGEPGNLTEGSVTLPTLELEAGDDDGRALEPFTLAAEGFTGAVGVGDVELPFPTLEAGTAGVQLPAFELAATGFAGSLVTGAITLPAYAVSGGLDGPLPLPEFELAAEAATGAVAEGALVLSAFTLAATGAPTVQVELPAFTLVAAGLVGAAGHGAVQPEAFALEAVAYQDAAADGAITLAVFTLVATASGTAVADGAVTFAPLSLEATALAGGVGTADLTVPLWTLNGAGYFSVVGTATIELPAFVLAGDSGQTGGAISTPSGAVRSTVVLNTRLKGVTLYQGLAANSFANFAGVTLAATADGIVALAGPDDLGVPIQAHLTGGVSDLGADALKLVLSAYVGYRAGGPLDLTLITDQHHEHVYRLEPRQAEEDLHGSRVKFGHGVKGRYWQWKLENQRGADFQLDQLRLMVQPLKRRV
jgi:hypothetical protein